METSGLLDASNWQPATSANDKAVAKGRGSFCYFLSKGFKVERFDDFLVFHIFQKDFVCVCVDLLKRSKTVKPVFFSRGAMHVCFQVLKFFAIYKQIFLGYIN